MRAESEIRLAITCWPFKSLIHLHHIQVSIETGIEGEFRHTSSGTLSCHLSNADSLIISCLTQIVHFYDDNC